MDQEPTTRLPRPLAPSALRYGAMMALLFSLLAPIVGAQEFDEKTFEAHKKQIDLHKSHNTAYATYELVKAALPDSSVEAGLRTKVRKYISDLLKSGVAKKPILLSLLKAIGWARSRMFTAQVTDLIYLHDPALRAAAFETLHDLDDPRTLVSLAAVFTDEKSPPDKRVIAIQALPHLKLWPVALLIDVLGSGQVRVQNAAQSALENLLGFPWGSDQASWKTWWNANLHKSKERLLRDALEACKTGERSKVLKIIDPKNLTQILKALKLYRDPVMRLQLLAYIEVIGSRKSIPDLTQLLGQDQRGTIQIRIVDILGSLLGKDDIEPGKKLLAILQSSRNEEDLRFAVLRALGKIKEIKSLDFVPALVPLLSGASPRLQSLAAESIGKIGRNNKAVQTGLMKLLGHKDPMVRRSAAKALGEVKATHATTILIAGLKDPDPNVRWCVVSSLGLLGTEKAHAPLAQLLLLEKVQRNVEMIITALVALKAQSAVPALCDFIKQNPSSRTIPQAGTALLKLSSSTAESLQAAVNELSKRGLKAQIVPFYRHQRKAFPGKVKDLSLRLAVLLLEIGKYREAALAYLEALEDGSAKDGLEKALAAAGTLGKDDAPAAAGLYLELAAAKIEVESKAWIEVLSLYGAAKPGEAKDAIVKALLSVINGHGQKRKSLLLALASLIDAAQKRRGFEALSLLSVLVKGPKAALKEGAPLKDWEAVRALWKSWIEKNG